MRRAPALLLFLAIASVHGVANTQVTSGSVTVLEGGDPVPRPGPGSEADHSDTTPAPTPRVLGRSVVGEDRSSSRSDSEPRRPSAAAAGGVRTEFVASEREPAPRERPVEPDQSVSDAPRDPAPIVDERRSGERGFSVTVIGEPPSAEPVVTERDAEPDPETRRGERTESSITARPPAPVTPAEPVPSAEPPRETFVFDTERARGIGVEAYDELLTESDGNAQAATALEPLEALQLREWMEQMRIAVNDHPSVRVARLQTDASRAGVDQAQAGRMPQITLSSEFGNDRSVRDGGDPTSAGGIPDDRDLQLSPTVDADLLLFDAGATRAGIDAARNRVEAGEDGTRAAVQDIAFRAAETLIDLATLRAQIRLAEENLSEVRRLRAMIQERSEAGRDSPSDMFRMNSRVQEARNTLEQRIAAFNAARANYAEVFRTDPIVLGLPSAYPPVPATTSAAVERAVGRNAQLAEAEAIARAAERDAEARQAQRWPQVSLGATVTGFDVTREGQDFYDSFIGLRVNAPLFDGGSRRAQVDQALRQASLERARVDELRANVVRALSEAYSNRASLQPRLEGLRQQVAANRETLSAYEEQFFTGRRPLNDLVTAQRELYGAQAGLLDLRGELHLQHFTIRRLTGDLLTEYGLPEDTG
ncbi:hypothetical protein A6K26_004540 [Gammaproteobacteria bacterium 2W06]|nr:hypothetical protein A6K26_004540 [Gammaproteobacteria bacterium 2W06]